MSLKQYCPVTLEQMRKVLIHDKGWNLDMIEGTKEYVFTFPLSTSPHIEVRVCSGITFDGRSRGCGKDAIRVFALDTKAGRGYIKTKRVYRIQTWEANLRKAVLNCFNQAVERRNRL